MDVNINILRTKIHKRSTKKPPKTGQSLVNLFEKKTFGIRDN